MPNTVKHPIVAFCLQETVYDKATGGQDKTWYIKLEDSWFRWMQFAIAHTQTHPGHDRDGDRNAHKYDKRNVVETIIQVNAETRENAHKKREDLPGPH